MVGVAGQVRLSSKISISFIVWACLFTLIPETSFSSESQPSFHFGGVRFSIDSGCTKQINKTVYLGLKKLYIIRNKKDGHLYYEDYVHGLIESVNSVYPVYNISYVSNLSHSSNAFFTDKLFDGRRVSTTFFTLKNVYYKDQKHISAYLDSIDKDHQATLSKYRLSGGAYSEDAFCKHISGQGAKDAYLVLPVDYKSDLYFSGVDCLKLSVLRMFCINVESDFHSLKIILNNIFRETSGGESVLTGYGEYLLKETIKRSAR